MSEDQSKILWKPSIDYVKQSNLTHYISWLEQEKGLSFSDYNHLWEWSTENIAEFWETVWQYFDVAHGASYTEICSNDPMPRTKWFTGATVNYSENIFRNATDRFPAIISASERNPLKEISWRELTHQVSALRNHLIKSGVKKGDCVVAFIPNIPEAIISFLTVNSLGAIWSSCSPDFGTGAVIDRFSQIEPKVLITVDGYHYGGKAFDKIKIINELVSSLPSLKQVIYLPYLNNNNQYKFAIESVSWSQAVSEGDSTISFERVEFSHPIWVLFSSGTTGVPKAITHSHGGVLMEHLKYLGFHNNVKEGDRCFWYTTTGWMMWNYIVASLLVKGTVVLYDGSPGYPNMNVLWKLAEEARITHFGTSAGFVIANMKANTNPNRDFNLSTLISIGSTGSPLPPEGFNWLYEKVKKDLWVASISGGTDVCSAFVGGNPLWPVYSGEIQCRALGCRLEAYNEEGMPVYNEVGEMVIIKPMPSMPVFLWNDPDYIRYTESYFEMFPRVWRHGDWIKVTPRNGIIIYGRSDSTLNRGGVRIGTSEIDRAGDKIPEVKDSLIICIEKGDGSFYMPLFVETNDRKELSKELKEKINTTIKNEYTPRHVPDDIIQIPEVPYTISGKKVETPVKKILMGKDLNKALNKDALKNPDALNFFIEYAKKINY